MKKIYTLISCAFISSALVAVGIGNTKNLLSTKTIVDRNASIVSVEKSMSAVTSFASNSSIAVAPIVPFFTENFSSGSTTALPTGWSVSTLNSAGTPTTADWKWKIGGGQGSFPVAALAATANTTPANGAMIYDSDFLCGASGLNAKAMLTSPIIDCSSHSTVKLSFYESYTRFHDTTFIEVSNNNATWTRFDIGVNEGVAANASVTNPTKVGIDISSVAANSDTVYIRFVFLGGPTTDCDYGWIVDDISVSELPVNDLALVKEFYDVSNGSTPISQVDSIFFGGRVANTGASAQTLTKLNAKVKSATNAVLLNTTSDSVNIAVGLDSLIGCNEGYLPTAKGLYKIVYTTMNDTVTDASLIDNSDSTQFVISDSTFISTLTGYSGNYFLFNSTTSSQFNWGYIFNLATADTLTSVAFATRATTAATETFTFELHQFENQTWTSIGSVNRAVLASEITTTTIKDISQSFVIDHAYSVLQPGTYAVTVSALSMGATSTILGASTFPNNSAPAIYDNTDPNGPFFTSTVAPYIKANFGKPNPTVGVKELKKSNVSVYPNPTNGLLNLKLAENKNAITKIFNSNGQLVFTENYSNKNFATLNLENLAQGVYTLQIITDGSVEIKKIIKQ